MMGAILAVCQRQLFTSRSGVDHNRALYAAETGLNTAIAQLESNAGWSSGYSQQATPDGQGDYTLSFAADPAHPQEFESVNNLAGAAAVASYRGPGTVPPYSVLLVVKGHAGVAKQTVEALLVPGVSPLQNDAIAVSGKVTMSGNITVDGIKSLSDLSPVPANLHSNQQGTGTEIKFSRLSPSDGLTVTGALTSSGVDPTSTAIQLATPNSVATNSSQNPQQKFPSVNIDALVADHAGSPGPALPTGPGPVTLNGGDNYYSGDVVINGDLTLAANAKIYVTGNLTVNGSIKGAGGVIVQGQTNLYGSADVTHATNDYVSVMSKGSVVLKGFDGQSYMNALSSTNPTVAAQWSDIQFATGKLQAFTRANQQSDVTVKAAAYSASDAYLDGLQSVIAPPWQPPVLNTDAGRLASQNVANQLKAEVGSGTPTQDFLADRFQSINDMYRQTWQNRTGGSARYGGQDEIHNYASYDPALDGGAYDAVQSYSVLDPTGSAQAMTSIFQASLQFDYNRLGSANFKGFIYTSGAFVARSDVDVMGTVIVNGDPNVAPLVLGGVTYQPGDFSVTNNSRFTYVDDMFSQGIQNLQGIGALDVKRWVNR